MNNTISHTLRSKLEPTAPVTNLKKCLWFGNRLLSDSAAVLHYSQTRFDSNAAELWRSANLNDADEDKSWNSVMSRSARTCGIYAERIVRPLSEKSCRVYQNGIEVYKDAKQIKYNYNYAYMFHHQIQPQPTSGHPHHPLILHVRPGMRYPQCRSQRKLMQTRPLRKSTIANLHKLE